MNTAKIFKSGNSQAVRLPKEFQFDVSEVQIFRRGDEVVLKKRLRNLGRVFELLIELAELLEIKSFDQKAATAYGDVRSSLEKKGNIIGSYDLLIAAHALSLDCILVTNNEKEFSRVDGLKIENWVNQEKAVTRYQEANNRNPITCKP